MRRFYLSVISGRRRGPLAAATRLLLSLGSLVYILLHGLRRLAYATGLRRPRRLPCKVVSVGNLTAGGTGKTPFVEMLARWFSRRNLRVAVLARGYGRLPDGRDDEEGIADLGLANVVRLTGADRAALARRAVDDHKADVIILDDGFQHWQVARDLDILLVDSTDPFSGGRRIPRGLLREHPAAAKRADLIVLTRADQAAPDDLAALRDVLGTISGGRPVIESAHRPVAVRALRSKKRSDVAWLKGRSLYAFCAIGNPEAFRRTLEAAGAKVEKFVAFEDHHRYTPLEVRRINAEAQEFMVEALVTTEKDASKLDPAAFERPLSALRIELEIVRGDDRLESALLSLIRDRVPAATAAGR